MTNAIRIRTQIHSDTIQIPELSSFIGKNVEVIVLEDKEVSPPVAKPKRQLGTLRGQFTVPDDFDAPLPEQLLRAFEGTGDE